MTLIPTVVAAALALTVSGGTFAPDPLLPGLGNDGYHATSYDLSYDFTPDTRQLNGMATMTATADKPLTKLVMDFAGGIVRSVAVDGRPAQFHAEGEKLLVVPAHTPLRGPFRVTVAYTVDRDAKVPSKVDNTSGWGNNKDGGFAWWGQPDRAHLFFPCNDDLTDKATFTYRVTVPDGWSAIANGTLTAQRNSGGRTTFVYSTAHPMATQLAQLAVGKFDLVAGVGPHGLPLRSAVPAGADKASLDRLPEYLSWLEGKIGRRYPFEVAGALGVDGHSPQQTFSLETQTLPIFPIRELSNSVVVVHELAHQWFGDSVGVKTWSDIWLSEGFATYLDHVWNAGHGGQPLDERMREAYKGDVVARGLGMRPAKPGRPDAMFGIGRGWGSLVAYALHEKVGEEMFWHIVQTYFDRYRDGSASSADFVIVASEVGGQELTGFLNDWLYGATRPAMPGHPDW